MFKNILVAVDGSTASTHALEMAIQISGKFEPIHAAMRADAMLEAGDLDGYGVWRRILRAAGELRVKEAGGSAASPA